jgi:FrmR/RcnR family transcriptional regulator, repressor of rcnA expression
VPIGIAVATAPWAGDDFRPWACGVVFRGFRDSGTVAATYLPNRQNTLPWYVIYDLAMAHVVQNKRKLLARVSRIRGQLNGIEKAIEEGRECGELLLTLAACRGALNALMAEILEGHVRQHVLDSRSKNSQITAGEELIDVIRRYLK